MSWHRFPIMHYDDTGQNLTFRCDGPRKSALKKPCREFIDCKKKTNNNIFRAFKKCNEYKNKKACTFKPCEHSPVLHSNLEHPPSCCGDRTRNKRINTDYVCLPELDTRTTKKRTRFTEAAGERSPCSILSLQSKYCQGNPYVIHCPKHPGVCDCQQNEAEVSRTNDRCCENRRRNISTDGFFYQPTCNESTTCNPICADDLPCILDKAAVYRKCRNTKSKKKLKNKKTGGDACMCYVDATTSTNGKLRCLKTIKPRRRDCYRNAKSCASYDDPCCGYYKDEATNTKDKSCCSKGRPRIGESQTSDCCRNTCLDSYVDFVDEAIGTSDKTGCSKIIKPKIAGCQTVRARIPECQKLTPIIYEYQHTKCNKICDTCDKPTECFVDEAVATNDKSGYSKVVYRIPGCQIPTPAITQCLLPKSCTDHCEHYRDSATDTLKKPGCFKVIRPKLRECRKPKWYDKFTNKSCVGSDFYKDASTSTKYKSRCSRSKIIRPRIHECQYSRWNCFRKTKNCTCCVDNAEICKCQQFKWKKIFRRKTKLCTEDEVTCGRKPECQRIPNPCISYVNVENECGRAMLPLYDVSEQCVENSCQSACHKFDFQCRTEPCREVYHEHLNSRQTTCGVATSPSLFYALLHRKKPYVKCCKQFGKQLCLRCRLFKYFERLMMGSVALCCAPCFLVAISYWFICYLLTNDCKKADETFRTPNCRDAPFQGGNCNRIQTNCLDPCSPYCINANQNCIFNAPPGYTVEMYSDKATDTGCLPNPCTKVTLTCNEEGNVCKKQNKIRISKRCRRKSCPNPQRKYNLYYVDDRGWVIKPIPDGACGGGDNNFNPDTCCNNTEPTIPICSIQKTLISEKLNYEDPCCNSKYPDICPSQKTFCGKVNYECGYKDCADTLCAPHKTICDTDDQDPCENGAEPETVIYCERANCEDACCSSPDPKSPLQNRIFCDRVSFQDPCACYYCTTCQERTVCSSKPWRPNDACICISDCECPKFSFWKWMFCKSKTRNKSQMQGNEYHTTKKGSNYQKIERGNSFHKAKMRSSYEKSKNKSGNNNPIKGSSYEKSKNGSGYNNPIKKSSYEKSKNGSGYKKPIMSSSYEKSKNVSGYDKPIMRSEHHKSKLGSGDNRSIIYTTGSIFHKSKMGRANSKSKMGRTYQKSKTRLRRLWHTFDHADEKFRSETEDACQEMVKDIVHLQPSMKQTFGDFSRSAFRLFRYILVSCCCCPVFCCFYCCNVCCYRMYCNVMC